MASQYIQYPPPGTAIYSSLSAFPSIAMEGWTAVANDTGYLYIYHGGAWVQATGAGTTGVTTMAAFGSAPNANGGSISGSTLTLQPASGSFPGGLTTGAQTIAGAKTFSTSLLSPIFSSSSANPSTGGIFRLANNETIGWRNVGNSGNKSLSLTAADAFLFNSTFQIAGDGTNTGFSLDASNAAIIGASGGSQTHAVNGNLSATGTITSNSVIVGSAANRISGLATIINGSGTLTLPTSTDTLVGLATTDTLTNKTLTAPVINTAVATAGTYNALTGFSLRDTSAAFNLSIGATSSTALSADRALTIDVKNASRTFSLQGNLTVTAAASISGTNTNDVSLAAFGSSPNANGLTLTSQAINMEPADATRPGGVSITTQTFAGAKTFTSAVTGNSFAVTSATIPVNGIYLNAANSLGFAVSSTYIGNVTGTGTSTQWNFGSATSGQFQFSNDGSSPTFVYNTGANFTAIAQPTFMYGGTAAQSLRIGGGNSSTNGATMRLYGGSHATLASVTEFYQAGTLSLSMDASFNVNVVSGDLKVSTAGKGLQIKEGSNAKMGTATLSGGTVTVSTTAVTSTSRIFLTVQSLGTVVVATPIAVTARSAGTSFTITSSSGVDTSVIAWMLVEPS